MNKNPGILGKKVGMTQYFNERGEVVRCTVVKAGCVVVGKRTEDKDGYSALVLGIGERKEKHTNKPLGGFYKKNGQSPKRELKELRLSAEEVAKYEVGEKVALDKVFEVGQHIDAQSKTRGRGFSGVFRRWSMAGGVDSHGTHEYFRHGGSIGCRATPGKVHKGKRMAGHMGDERVTTINVGLYEIRVEERLIFLRGAVPGGKNAIVELTPSTHTAKRMAGLVTEAQEKSKNPMKASKAKR